MWLSEGFLRTAKERLSPAGKLSEAGLRRSLSDQYFALFHRLCEELVRPLGEEAHRYPLGKEAWIRLYRLPEHKQVYAACGDQRLREFPREIMVFATHLRTMKAKREESDYDASAQIEASDVRKMLEATETALALFGREELSSVRYQFALFASLKRVR